MRKQKHQKSMWELDMAMPRAAPMRMQGRAKGAFDPFDRPSLNFGGGGGLSGLFGAQAPMQRQVRQVQVPQRMQQPRQRAIRQREYAPMGLQEALQSATPVVRKGIKTAAPIVKKGIERATPYVRTATGKIISVSREAAQIGAEKTVSLAGKIRERYAEYKESRKAAKEAAQFEKRRGEVGLYEAVNERKRKQDLREAERKGAEAWKKMEEKQGV